MAIENGYATLVEFKILGDIDSTDSDDDTAIDGIIEGASRYIDSKTQRTFYSRTETRNFDVPRNRSRSLFLDDDLLTITTLTNGDGNTIASSEYHLLPKNLTPFNEVRLTKTTTVFWATDSGGDDEWVIALAGGWGWVAATPDDIREACLMISQSFYRRRMGENVSGIATVTAAGVVITPQDIPSVAADILARYMKRL